jgi:hypothetical protein
MRPAGSSLRVALEGLGIAALATMIGRSCKGAEKVAAGGLPGLPHFPPTAKRAVFLHMLGGPPHIDLFDYKPGLQGLGQ